MKAKKSDWYKHGWSLDIKNQTWTQDTENQVDFIVKTMNLQGNERILDLACGYGRHAISLARRGFSVVGIDITKDYVDYATKVAVENGLNAKFIRTDIREVGFENEFDVVLNLADGAIGYLETDEENLKIFDVISRALKVGGQHLMDICNADHAELYFPRANWEAGEKTLALSQFDWNPKTRRMMFGGCDIPYGVPLKRPEFAEGDPTRLYSIKEIKEIFDKRNMKIDKTFSDYYGTPASPKNLQLMVFSTKINHNYRLSR